MAVQTIIYSVKDLAASKAVFTALLGVEPMADQPYYVGYQVGDQHYGLAPSQDGETGPVPYWHVDDMEARIETLVEAGATVKQEPTVVAGTRRTAVVTDPDGNRIGLLQDS